MLLHRIFLEWEENVLRGSAEDDFMTFLSQENKYNKTVTSEAFVFIV